MKQNKNKESKMNHLAIIMDGNARCAAVNNLPRSAGHQKGAQTAKELISKLIDLGIPYITLYAFSSENWKRPEDEVSLIMKLLSYYVESELKSIHKYNIRLKVIGDFSKLSDRLKSKINHATELTANNDKMTLCIALGYGSRAEIVSACQQIVDSGIKKISEEVFRSFLYDPDMPDVDLLIRPSGVYRISNFLLWQCAYAELYFTDKFWPDFTINDIKEAIKDYSKRTRNFGRR